ITLFASAFGGETTLTATVDVVPATGPPVPDVVTIKTMTWRLGHLKIGASSSNPNAILSAWLTNSDSFMFNLSNDGHGKYGAARPATTNPEFITIKSNSGGSADGTPRRGRSEAPPASPGLGWGEGAGTCSPPPRASPAGPLSRPGTGRAPSAPSSAR